VVNSYLKWDVYHWLYCILFYSVENLMLGFWLLLSRISNPEENLECHFFAVERFKTLEACGLPNIISRPSALSSNLDVLPASIMAPDLFVLAPLDAFGTSGFASLKIFGEPPNPMVDHHFPIGMATV
jgi:hypothetical protein